MVLLLFCSQRLRHNWPTVNKSHTPTAAEEENFATWGTDVPDDLVLDQKKLAEALKK
ncbi:pre-mRNA-splicing factor SLU7-like, partial [Trifolium medium]|nr:pre-mRNA-splicing factor SLU7-like [Trifolium medium]